MTLRDRLEHRDWLFSLLQVPPQGLVVDLGCGTGDDLQALAATAPISRARFVGYDSSPKAISEAIQASGPDPRVTFETADLSDPIPFGAASIDVAFSHNLLECLSDPRAFAQEVARTLRPRGKLVVAHWDWDSQCFDGPDKALVRRIVHAFADWKQDWMDHSDGWMGRRLWKVFEGTHAFEGTVHTRVLTNTSFSPPHYGYDRAQDCHGLVKRGLLAQEDADRFLASQAELDANGEYFYSITGYAYVGRRKAK